MRLTFTVLLFALILLAPAPAQASFKAKCIPGEASSPTCTWWNAKVTLIADGDTVDVRIDGARKINHVRFIGINAMELQTYSRTPSRRRGDCHGLEATSLIERYIKKSKFKVRLAAQKPSSRSGGRLRRSVWVRSGGRWLDLGRAQLEAGQALWLPNGDEWAHNAEYARLAGEAIAAQRNLYDSDFCGAGPDQDVPLTLAVNWDADGGDEKNVNGEYVDIRNPSARAVSLAGWFFRDSFLRRSTKANPPGYEFSAAAVVPARSSLRLRIGCGNNSAREHFWCEDGTDFENPTGDQRHLGDGGYLFDPQRDLRASFIYPCLVSCTDSAAGRVRIVAHPNRPEAMTIENTSNAPVDISDHALKLRNKGKSNEYVFGQAFPPGSVLAVGASFRYVHPTDNRYSDNGGVVELRTLDDQLTTCVAWGFGSC